MGEDGTNKRAAGVLVVDKRNAKRYGIALEVLFVWRGQLTRATALDISMTGMRICSEVDIGKGAQLEVHFAAPGDAEMHQLVSRVVWSEASPDVAGLFEIGLQFSTLPHSTNVELARLVRELGGTEEADDLPMMEDEDVLPMHDEGNLRFSAPAEALLPAFGSDSAKDSDWTVSGRLDDAVAEDSRTREKNAKMASALSAEAKAAQAKGEAEQAVALLRQATDLIPDSAEMCEELAAALYLTGEVIESAQLFDRALRLRLERGEKNSG